MILAWLGEKWNVSNLKRLHGHLSGVPCCNSPARCYFNSIHMWLDIPLPSKSEDINSEKEAQGSQRIKVKGHRKLQDNIWKRLFSKFNPVLEGLFSKYNPIVEGLCYQSDPILEEFLILKWPNFRGISLHRPTHIGRSSRHSTYRSTPPPGFTWRILVRTCKRFLFPALAFRCSWRSTLYQRLHDNIRAGSYS